jgi:hypothetical protein
LLDLDSGKIKDAVLPGKEISTELLQTIKYFGGIESVAVAPDGSVLAVLNSTTIQNDRENFVPLLKYLPNERKFHNYIYPIDPSQYQPNSKVEIGALQIVDQNTILLSEVGRSSKGQALAGIYLYQYQTESSKIQVTSSKKLLVDLNTIGWKAGKPSGVSFFGDSTILGIVNKATKQQPPSFWLVTLAQPVIPMTVLQKLALVLALLVFAGFFYFVFRVIFPPRKKT